MKWFIDTTRPIAYGSWDYLEPQGSKFDNSFNLRFNARLYEIARQEGWSFPISVLDLGCGGGAFVKTILDDGNIAVGLDGSDYSQKNQRAAWATIPDYLFTCDITYPFIVHTGDRTPYLFDVITMFEVVEHIEEWDLPKAWRNVRTHLKDGGLYIITTPDNISHGPTHHVDHHRTRQPWDWWEKNITAAGFKREPGMEVFIGSSKNWVRMGKVRNVYRKLPDES